MRNPLIVATLATILCCAPASAQQGVANDEVVIGTIQDLSGPLAGFGKQARNGMLLRVDEINEQGGMNGRRLRLVVEDSGYDPRKASLAAEKLLNRDRIFMMVGHIGTAQNLATVPLLKERNVVNFFPLTGAREMYEPADRLKYAFIPSYFEQMVVALPRLAREKGAKKVCTMYQDDEAGLEILRGAEAGLKTIGMEIAERTSFKRGATEFSSQMSRLQSSGCDFIVLGTAIRETIGGIGTARKMGFSPTFLASSGAYTDLIHKLGGPAMNGLYATHTAQHPYLDDTSQQIRFWAGKYRTKFNEDPTVFSVYGYTIVDAFAKAAIRAGRSLNTDSFVKAMDGTSIPADMFGSPPMSFAADRRLGSPDSRISQIQDGRWKVVSDYLSPPKATK